MRTLPVLVTATLALAACGGDSGGGDQPQTEEAAIEAATKAVRGAFLNNVGDVLDFLSEECRASVDEQELREGLLFAQLFLQSDDYEISDIEVVGTASEFSPEEATIAVEVIAPEGADLGLLQSDSDDVVVFYENGKWVNDDCDFEDPDGGDAADLDAELEALGLAGTQDDPVPGGVAAPIGAGFQVATSEWMPDAFDAIVDVGGSEPFIEDGHQIAMLAYDVGYDGSQEPARLNQVSLELVGSDGVGIDQTSCGAVPSQLYFSSREVFSGAATSTVSCFAAPADKFPETPIVSMRGDFGGRSVFFSPTVASDSPSPVVASTGPAEQGSLTEDRLAPTPLGTPADVGEGWTMTVNGLDTDAERAILDESQFNDPAPAGSTYALLDVSLTYDGTEDSSSLFSVDIGLVGNSNVSAEPQCSLSEIPGQLDQFADVFPGGTAEGTICLLVDDADIGSLVAYATAEAFADERAFFAVD